LSEEIGRLITDFDHYTVLTADHEASRRFYETALGLTVREREGSSVPAFEVSIGEREVVHVFQDTPATDVREEPGTGRLRHVEFWATGLAEARERLGNAGVQFSERTLPDKHQVQMRDPDGIAVNLNFPLSEAPA
jgi:catechol 2,3-dioxygenase-like lactoylglutathione lyase family enzyme